MSRKIQLRRGTSSAWTSAATVLATGEIGLETDTGKFKIGDGATAWASLAYFGSTQYQPLDSDLTAIAALSTTSYGRSLLTTADAAALATASGVTAHLNDTDDAHDASAVSVLDAGGYYTGTNVETVLAELPSRYASLGAGAVLAPGQLHAAIGDSILNGSSASNYAYSMLPEALYMVGGAIARLDSIEAGVPGDTISGMLARMPALYAAYPQIRCTHIMAGANDAGAGVTVASYAADMTAAIAFAKRYGPVFVYTPTPRSSAASASLRNLLAGYRMWIMTVGRALGGEVVDTWADLVDTTTGYLASAYDSGDGLHPNTLGHQRLGRSMATAILRTANLPTRYNPLASIMDTTALLTADPLNTRASAAGGSWYEQPGGTGTSPTYSMVADTSGILPAGARWARMDFDATASGGTRRLATTVNSNWAVGDTLATVGYVRVTDMSANWEANVIAGTSGIAPGVVNQSAVAVGVATPWFVCAGLPTGVTDEYLYRVFKTWVVPAGVTSMAMWNSVLVPTGSRIKVDFEIGIANLTTLGIAPSVGAGASIGSTVSYP